MEDEAKSGTNWTKVLVIIIASLAVLAVATGIGFAVAGPARGGCDGTTCTGKGQGDCGGAGTGCTGRAGQASGSCHGQAGGTASPPTCPDCANGAAAPAPAK